MKVVVRKELSSEHESVRTVNDAAFGRSAEADLVKALRENGKARISLVAETEGRIVGHILFSPMSFDVENSVESLLGLAPMAVLPEFQKKGIGSRLVTSGLAECKARGCQAVFVLGHAEYYPKFGFIPASRFGIRSIYEVPDEVFLAIELEAGSLDRASGVVRYGPEFDEI